LFEFIRFGEPYGGGVVDKAVAVDAWAMLVGSTAAAIFTMLED
jgi:hypothetical protein